MTLQPSGWQAPEPEIGPAPGVAFGGPGERLVAYIVDLIIIGVAVIAIAIVGGILTFILPVVGILSLVVGIVFVPLVYFPYYWSSSGQTPGMKMMRIKVVRDRDGGPVTGGQAILRLLGYWVSGLVFYIGYIWIFIDKRKRGWHDLIAGTVVVEAGR